MFFSYINISVAGVLCTGSLLRNKTQFYLQLCGQGEAVSVVSKHIFFGLYGSECLSLMFMPNKDVCELVGSFTRVQNN